MDRSYAIVWDLDEQIEINFKSGESWSLHEPIGRRRRRREEGEEAPDEEGILNDLDLEFSGDDITIPPPPILDFEFSGDDLIIPPPPKLQDWSKYLSDN